MSTTTPEKVFEECFEFGLSGSDNPDNQLLYHYTGARAALESILVDQTLRLSSYRSMRDPLENKRLPILVEYQAAAEGKRLSPLVATELLHELRGQMRVLSLTMDASGYEDAVVHAFGRGYARPRMWEHYADKHAGVCLVFSAAAMCGPFLKSIRCHGAANCKPVTYTQGGFAVSPGRILNGDGLTENTATDVITKHVIDHEDDFWFLKLLDWDTEYEYRFVLLMPDVGPDVPIDIPFGNCLRGSSSARSSIPTYRPRQSAWARSWRFPSCTSTGNTAAPVCDMSGISAGVTPST